MFKKSQSGGTGPGDAQSGPGVLGGGGEPGRDGKNWNDTLKLLRGTFTYLLPAGGINPFADMPTRETETVFHQPFTPEEMGAINEAAKADELIGPLSSWDVHGDAAQCTVRFKVIGKAVNNKKPNRTNSSMQFPVL